MSQAPPTKAQAGARAEAVLRGNLPALDGVRGLAIAGVLACHFSNAWPELGRGDRLAVEGLGLGWAGVDLFFVLSGFLITGVLLDELGAPHWWRNFLVRRALRIFPLYYLSLALFGLFGPALGLIDRWTFGRWGAWYWAYLGNWAYAARQGIPPLSHFWSLAVEEQFYLVWPLVVFRARGRRLVFACAALVVASPALRAVIVYGSGWPVGSAFRVTPGRLDGLAAGALLAVAFRSPVGRELARRGWRWAVILGALGFVALGAMGGFDMHWAPLEIWSHTFLAFLFGGLLAGAVAGALAGARGGALARLLTTRPLRELGRLSYGLYVIHYFVHVWALRALGARPATAALLGTRAGYLAYATAGILASLVLSWASYELMEKRFLALKDRLAPRRRALVT